MINWFIKNTRFCRSYQIFLLRNNVSHFQVNSRKPPRVGIRVSVHDATSNNVTF